MGKRIAAFALAAVLVMSLQLPVFAIGWAEEGDYSATTIGYGFITDESVLVYQKNAELDPEYDQIYTGSVLYVPIGFYDEEDDDEGRATAKQIKDDNVTVSYKAVSGANYVENVIIVDGKKEKIDELQSGAYAKVEFSPTYTGSGYGYVDLKLVLNINKVAYQDTEAELICNVRNWVVSVRDNSVYGAQVSTRFEVDDRYDGEATFDMGNGIRYTAKVKRGATYVINLDKSPNYNIDLMYPDAYLEFYNFRGNLDTFASTGKLEIPIKKASFKSPDGPRVYAYEVRGDVLYAIDSSGASYNSRTSVLTINTRTLGEYVLSNTKLKQAVEEDADDTFQSGYADDPAEQSAGQGGAPAAGAAVTPKTAAPAAAQTSNTTIINATNKSGENPLTADAPAGRAAALWTVCALAGFGLWKTRPKKRSDK